MKEKTKPDVPKKSFFMNSHGICLDKFPFSEFSLLNNMVNYPKKPSEVIVNKQLV